MASSAVDICNSALIKIGSDRILSLSDDSERARLVNEQYNKCRKELLRSHPWNFAIARVQLAEVSTTPLFEYDHQFQIPTNCLRVLKTDLMPDDEWKIEGRYILCNEATLNIQFIKDEEDVSKFDAMFDELLALRLAMDLCYAQSGSSELSDKLYAAYQRALTLCRSIDAQEGTADRIISDEWLNRRF